MTTSTPAAAPCGCATDGPVQLDHRPGAIKRALRLEFLTVGWNVVEGVIAVAVALLSGSVALLAFGIDSFVECSSAVVMIWRLRAERDHRLSERALEAVEGKARRLVAASLFLLAAYVTFDAVKALWFSEAPRFSAVGVAQLALSIAAMLW